MMSMASQRASSSNMAAQASVSWDGVAAAQARACARRAACRSARDEAVVLLVGFGTLLLRGCRVGGVGGWRV